jgi:hypothetical protein
MELEKKTSWKFHDWTKRVLGKKDHQNGCPKFVHFAWFLALKGFNFIEFQQIIVNNFNFFNYSDNELINIEHEFEV